MNRPFPEAAPNVTALEVFDAENMHAVEIRVDGDRRSVHGFRPLPNPEVALGGRSEGLRDGGPPGTGVGRGR